MKYCSVGTIIYGPNIKVVANVDENLVEYYRSLIPKCIDYQIPKAKPHITIVRENVEKPTNFRVWNKYGLKKLDFQYDGVLHFSETYIWMNVRSETIRQIRLELGLPAYRFGNQLYHITIGNFKFNRG